MQRMTRYWVWGLCVVLLLITVGAAHAEERWRGGERRGFPFTDERWEGSRDWRPDRDLRRRWQDPPDRIIIDKPGKCEVRCERHGREYRCREYRC
jgi:hypothetical protein